MVVWATKENQGLEIFRIPGPAAAKAHHGSPSTEPVDHPGPFCGGAVGNFTLGFRLQSPRSVIGHIFFYENFRNYMPPAQDIRCKEEVHIVTVRCLVA